MTTETAPGPSNPSRERLYLVLNLVVSVAAVSLLSWLLLLRSPSDEVTSFSFMPAVNAAFNALSTTCIVLGLLAIRARRVTVHRALMLSALMSSALFLAGYIFHHYVHGDTPYPVDAPLRGVYLGLLLSHVVLSIVAFPMVLWTFALALRGQIARHRKFAKWTFPVWLYVSITGVIVFVMLRAAGA
jgi:putative membrane protein